MSEQSDFVSAIGMHSRKRSWSLDCWLMGFLGMAMIWQRDIVHSFSVIQETIVLVVLLGGLMGITRIPFPSSFAGKPIPIWAYPVISGIISGVMDSFLVLLLVGAAKLEGKAKDCFKFRAINMVAALIGGLTLYFGEVYMLPLALKYGQRHWYSMLPVVSPVAVFLAFLAWIASRLDIKVTGMTESEPHASNGKKTKADVGDYVEFGVAIFLLLATHNSLLCLGCLLVYAFCTGQGEDLIDVLKTETEVGVMLLLVFAAFIASPIEPHMQAWTGWWAFLPAMVNGVLMGAVYPASGDFWHDTHVLSTAVLITPISSLVGVILFKTLDDWKDYLKFSLPIALAWFLLAGAWFYGPWPLIQPHFEGTFGAPVAPANPRE